MTVVAERVSPRLSIDEYFAMPEDDSLTEFENGELTELDAPHWLHQEVSSEIVIALREHVKAHGLGKVLPAINLQLDANRNYIPDAVFVRKEHLDRLNDDTGRLHGAPDLAVEVTSPGSAARDRLTKFNAYHGAGVEWYWLVDRDEWTIEEYHATAEGYVRSADAGKGEVFRPRALPGLEFNLAELLG